MAKNETQRPGRATALGKILRELKRKDYEGIVAGAREYFGPANELANGAKLNVLRVHMGRLRFGQFMCVTLPKLGISKSTGYRWARLAAGLPLHFKNPLVRAQLMLKGSGRGLLKIDGRGKVRLTPALRTALKQLPPEPRRLNEAKAQEWTVQLLAETAKARNRARIRLYSGT